VQNSADIAAVRIEDHLANHRLNPELLRSDNFTAFFERRQAA